MTRKIPTTTSNIDERGTSSLREQDSTSKTALG
jgi:hypothetical protein